LSEGLAEGDVQDSAVVFLLDEVVDGLCFAGTKLRFQEDDLVFFGAWEE
jgi:hypothetical protein